MNGHEILRSVAQFNLCHDNSDGTKVYYVENTILTKHTKGKGVSYTFGEDVKDQLMLLSSADFGIKAAKRTGNDFLTKEVALSIWRELGDVPVTEDGDLEETWSTGVGVTFSEGTDREYIWSWFESFFDLSVAEDLMFQS